MIISQLNFSIIKKFNFYFKITLNAFLFEIIYFDIHRNLKLKNESSRMCGYTIWDFNLCSNFSKKMYLLFTFDHTFD